MTPTIYVNDESSSKRCIKRKISSSLEVNQSMEIEIKKQDNVLEKREPKDDETIRKPAKRQRRRKRMASSSETSTSTMSSDDYGTDSELMAINQHNNNGESSCRCASPSTSDSEDDGFDQDTTAKHYVDIGKLDKLLSTSQYNAVIQKIATTTALISNTNTKYLFDITIRTVRLARNNQELQTKLFELQSDTRKFIDSIIENPENQQLKDQLEMMRK